VSDGAPHWPRMVTNPDANLVVTRSRSELVESLRALAERLAALPDPLVVEEPAHLEVLRDAYRFFDQGMWNTPEIEAWCVVKHYPEPGWRPYVWSGHPTREEAEGYAELLAQWERDRYPHGKPSSWQVERRLCPVVDLRTKPTADQAR